MPSKKAPQAKATLATTPFQNTQQSTFSSDFGTGTSKINPQTGELTSSSQLNPGLQQAATTATGGLNTNLSYLAQDPSQIYAGIAAGQNPYFNAINEQSNRATNQTIANARLQGAGIGNNNSTLLGSELGRISNDDILRQNQNAAAAYQLGQQTAGQNVATNQNALTGLGNLVYPLASGSNSDLMTALAAQGQNSQFNAAQQNQIALANQAAQQQQNAANSSVWGNLANAGLTAAGTIAGGLIGGPAGAMVGSQAGNVFGGLGPQSLPSYGTSNMGNVFSLGQTLNSYGSNPLSASLY